MLKNVMVNQTLVTPSKIVCVGRNYIGHIQELNNEKPQQMVIFIKPNSAITTQLNSYHDEPLHYEAELCFMVKNNRIAAVGVGLDLTKRQLQQELKSKGLPWERAKCFDGAALFSPFMPVDDSIDNLAFELSVNNALRQRGVPSEMLYQPREIFEQIGTFMTLNDGDIVMTGTPKGVGIINAGECFELSLYQHDKLITTARWLAQ